MATRALIIAALLATPAFAHDAQSPAAPASAPAARTDLATVVLRDLELYVEGGLTPGEALATATIVPAQVFGLDDRGVIAVGKRSDLVLIDGDPSQDIGTLRHVEKVMLGDALLDDDELRSAAGISGRPK